MERVSQKNGSNVVCLYDLIPLVFPKAFAPGSVRAFEIWFEKIVLPADAVVGISKSVAEEFYACVQGREIGGACPSAGFTFRRRLRTADRRGDAPRPAGDRLRHSRFSRDRRGRRRLLRPPRQRQPRPSDSGGSGERSGRGASSSSCPDLTRGREASFGHGEARYISAGRPRLRLCNAD